MAGLTEPDLLDRFLEIVAGRPFIDGQSDCMMTVADWLVMALGCEDPAQDLRGAYDSDRGAFRLLLAAGGLSALMARHASRLGLSPALNPLRGDVGAIAVNGRDVAGICLGPSQWAIASRAGIYGLRAESVAAWRVPFGRSDHPSGCSLR